jgi:phage FluMu protein Com
MPMITIKCRDCREMFQPKSVQSQLQQRCNACESIRMVNHWENLKAQGLEKDNEQSN